MHWVVVFDDYTCNKWVKNFPFCKKNHLLKDIFMNSSYNLGAQGHGLVGLCGNQALQQCKKLADSHEIAKKGGLEISTMNT